MTIRHRSFSSFPETVIWSVQSCDIEDFTSSSWWSFLIRVWSTDGMSKKHCLGPSSQNNKKVHDNNQKDIICVKLHDLDWKVCNSLNIAWSKSLQSRFLDFDVETSWKTNPIVTVEKSFYSWKNLKGQRWEFIYFEELADVRLQKYAKLWIKSCFWKISRQIIVWDINVILLLHELMILQVIEESSSFKTLIRSVATNRGVSCIYVFQFFFLMIFVSRSFQFCLLKKTCSSDFFVSSDNTSFHTRSATESYWSSCLRNFVYLVNLINKICFFLVTIISTRRVPTSS